MVPGSHIDLSNAEDMSSKHFITKEMNTDQYYHLGLALGLSYQTLDSIQFRSRQNEEFGVYTPNQMAAIFMIRYWKCLQHSVSLADDHLRDVWKSLSESRGSVPVLNQQRRGEKKHDTNVEEVFEGEIPRKEPSTILTEGLHDLEVGIPGKKGHCEERLHHKRTNTPSVRSDSLSSSITLLEEEEEEEEGCFPKRYFGTFFKPISFEMSFVPFFPFDALISAMTLPMTSHIILSIDEHHEDEDTTEASPNKTDSASPRPSASTSADIPPNDASAAAVEASTSKARGPSIDDRHEDEDKYHSEGIFDQTGGELHIPSYGLTLSIPSGALPDGSGETITLDVLTDVPPEITLRHDETLVTYGFQCLPSGLQFASEKPVRLKIPHCVNLIDPKKVQVVLYSMNHGGEDDRIVQSSRTCRVTYNHVEICLEHFSKGFLAFIKDAFSMKDKRMSFMPFLPKIMPESREPTLQFRMVTKPHGNSWRDVHDIGKEADYQPAKDEDDEMNVKEDDMEVTCQLSDNDILTEIVPARFLDKTKHTVYFELDFNGKADDLLVKLKVIQSNLPMDIKFRTLFIGSRGITETSPGKTDSASPRPSASTPVDIPPQGAPTSAGKVSTSKARPTDESREQDFDDFLKKVAQQTDKDTDIDSLGKELGFEPAEIKRYIQTNEKYYTVTYMGTLSMLRDWRNRTTEPKEREELKKALIASNHHRLADNLLNDDMAKS